MNDSYMPLPGGLRRVMIRLAIATMLLASVALAQGAPLPRPPTGGCPGLAAERELLCCILQILPMN